jgi:threonine/homoserine/homoserine lactone efflux protein
MADVWGALLPLAVAVAISPAPITVMILMLFTPRAAATSSGLLIGWVAGILLAMVTFVTLASTTEMGSVDEPSRVASWIKLMAGCVLLGLGVRQWHNRPDPQQRQPPPRWMRAIDSFGAVKAVGLGLALSALNPMNLALCVGAAVDIAGDDLDGARVAVAIGAFTAIASCALAAPVGAYAVRPARLRAPLDSLRTWLESQSVAMLGVLLLVIGAVLVGRGISGLL